MDIPLRLCAATGLLVAALSVASCDRYGTASGPTVHEPMFRGTPKLESLRPAVRLPDAAAVPLPNFKLAREILLKESSGIVFAHSVTRPLDGANGYAEIESEQLQDGQCNPRVSDRYVALGGIVVPMWLETVAAPRCPTLGTVYTRMEVAEIKDVTGRLFPLAVGNVLLFSSRRLLRSLNSNALHSLSVDRLIGDVGDAPDTGFSDKAFWQQWRYEVVERQEHYRLKNGKDIGDVFIIRSTLSAEAGTPSTEEWYFSPRLSWPLLRRQSNGLVVKLEDWE